MQTEVIGDVKKPEPKKPRNVRRLEKSKKEILDEFVLKYFVKRSTLVDPDGLEAACLFDEFDHKWKAECTCFNRTRSPIKLRYEAFTESVEFYLNMEKESMKKAAEANKTKDFDSWLRHVKMGEALFFIVLWYKVISFGNREKWIQHLKNYYVKNLIDGTN